VHIVHSTTADKSRDLSDVGILIPGAALNQLYRDGQNEFLRFRCENFFAFTLTGLGILSKYLAAIGPPTFFDLLGFSPIRPQFSAEEEESADFAL